MHLLDWLTPRKQAAARSETSSRRPSAFDITKDGSTVTVRADDIEVWFTVEGIELPADLDANFAVWALLPRAMEEGFDLHFNHPIDAKVAENAERLSEIWEMWVPDRYRSVRVRGAGTWSRPHRQRAPLLLMFSGGVDSTYAAWINRSATERGYAATICGIDRITDANFSLLLNKTAPLLEHLNYSRILIRTNMQRTPSDLTHGFTLAGGLFLLSDLFEAGGIAADQIPAADMLVHPWGSNHVTNQYFAGSDFAVETIGADVTRTEKVAALAAGGIDPSMLSFCRKQKLIPKNCGTCGKCIATKAMFLLTTGKIPQIFLDNDLSVEMLRKLTKSSVDRIDVFDLHGYAKRKGLLDRLPELGNVLEECRALAASEQKVAKAKDQR